MSECVNVRDVLFFSQQPMQDNVPICEAACIAPEKTLVRPTFNAEFIKYELAFDCS